MFRITNVALAVALMSASSSAFAPATFGVSKDISVNNVISVATPSFNTNKIQLFMSSTEEEVGPSKLVRKPDSAVELTITAPGSATKAAYDKACAEISKTISIPGFRKGAKIPPAVLENAVAAKGGRMTLRTQAIQSLLNELLEPALKEEHNLEPIGQPALATPADELAEKFKPGEPIEMVVNCDVWPDIAWSTVEGQEKPYYGLKASYTRKPFNQARLDQAMKDLAERYATTEPAPADKELEMGDQCIVDMKGFMAAEDGTSKGEPLPDAASGDDVEIILGDGRYMTGLVEGVLGAKVGETRTVYVTFPEKLRDKTLAGKKAVFDVTVKEANVRTVPKIDDELANSIRPGLNAEGLEGELRKAVDEQDAGEWIEARNTGLAKALACVMDVEVPDTLVTNQARDKYAQMMAEFRTQGMADDEIKKLITPENFQKYKEIQKKDIVDDFKTSMAADEIARLEGIEVPSYQIDEQLEALKKEAEGEDLGDENQLRAKIESTLMRRMVFDHIAEFAEFDITYQDDKFDEEMMEKLAQESLEREMSEDGVEEVEGKKESEPVIVAEEVEEVTDVAEDEEDKVAKAELAMKTEQFQRSLLSAKLQNDKIASAAAAAQAKAEAAIVAEKFQRSLLGAKLQNDNIASAAAAAQAKAEAAIVAEKFQRSLLSAKFEVDAKVKVAAAAAKAKAEAEAKAEVEAAQAKAEAEAERLANLSPEEKAFEMLVSLGLVDLTPDPEDPDYDHSNDDEIVS